jgi:hypothetical protein
MGDAFRRDFPAVIKSNRAARVKRRYEYCALAGDGKRITALGN